MGFPDTLVGKESTPVLLDFSCGSTGKESTFNVGDLGLIPGMGRSPREGKGYPLQYSGLENSMECVGSMGSLRNHWVTFTFTFKGNCCCCVWLFYDPMDCSPLGFPVCGIYQARILEQVAISFSGGSSWPRDQPFVSCICKWILYCWDTREAH